MLTLTSSPRDWLNTQLPFLYLKEKSSKKLQVVSKNGASILDASAPQAQQLSGVDGSFSLVERHRRVKLVLTGGCQGA